MQNFKATIDHFAPMFTDRLNQITDPRGGGIVYSISEIIFATIALFLLKQGSRNAFNNSKIIGSFAKNYKKIFNKSLPHMDTVDDVLRKIDFTELEKIQTELVRQLISKKVFSPFRLFKQYHQVAIDGTGVMKVDKGHCDHCLTKVLNRGKKNEKTIYFHNVLEAKLICSNGFAISIGSEWIENDDDYKKQDCELKAFKRLAVSLKEKFPRLPIVLVADGLYPNKTFFDICTENKWEFIVTLKDGNLKLLWEEIEEELITNRNRRIVALPGKREMEIRWLNDLTYESSALSWVECVEENNKFVFLTSFQQLDCYSATEVSNSGRLRSNIEDSFNTQKNRGYKMKHKYSRVSMAATKAYYACLQIGHIFNQLFELSSCFKRVMPGKMTIKEIRDFMLALLKTISPENLDVVAKSSRMQMRYG